MSYLKKLIISLKYVIIYIIINPVVLFLSTFIYGLYDINNVNNFVNKHGSIILIISNLLYLIYLIKQEKIKKDNYNILTNYPKISMIIGLSLFLNSIIFLIKIKPVVTVNPIISFLGTVVIGPIIEEIIFRYVLYNSLTKFNSKKISIILSTIIFALMHNGIINIIFAFIIGLIITIIYSKNKNITEVIILHIITNFLGFLITDYNQVVLILSIVCIIISLLGIYKFKHPKYD